MSESTKIKAMSAYCAVSMEIYTYVALDWSHLVNGIDLKTQEHNRMC